MSAPTTDGAIADAVAQMARAARATLPTLANASSEQKTACIRGAAAAIAAHANIVLAANELDVREAAERGATPANLDRLRLSAERISALARSIEQLATIADPVGRVLERWSQPNGLRFERVSVPLGVIGVIYESRPNVTADAALLGLLSGNATILRGGSDALRSSTAIFEAIAKAIVDHRFPAACIQMIPTRDRAAVSAMLGAAGLIDVIVPRGGKSLVARVQEEARVPVFAHLDGNNHTYIHADADLAMAVEVTRNAKLRRTGICGATETVLFDRASAISHAPRVLRELLNAGCEVRGAEALQAIDPRIIRASEDDYRTEFLAPIIAAGVVEDLDGALTHIRTYGSSHTDAIITSNEEVAARFLTQLDSAIVLHNASTQFADGGEFGFGAEIGIATGRMHARGPVGAAQLTTFKYIVRGDGTVRKP
jgi:glutamate-5-semialdehyde dehydrogenase